MPFKNLCFIFTLAALPFSAGAVLFQNDYLSFELPENWKCKPFKTDWVCHSIHSRKSKEAMIILTAKEAGSLDNFTEYEKFLSKNRTIRSKTGQPVRSKIISPGKKLFLNNHPWVDGWFEASEVPKYYTRYEVTVCCGTVPKLAVLVAISAHRDRYSKYSKAFMRAIKTLKLTPDISMALNKMRAMGTHESMGNIAAYMGDLIGDGELDDEDAEGEGLGGGLDATAMGGLGAGLLALVAYFMIRAKRKKRRREGSGRRKSRRHRSSSRRRR